MTLADFFISLGLNISSTAIYDFIKSFFKNEPEPTLEKCMEALQNHLAIENAQIYSEKIINFLAKNGDIEISGSNIFAKESILLQSSKSTKFLIKSRSSTMTDHTSIVVGEEDSIKGAGGASIKQSSQGITLST